MIKWRKEQKEKDYGYKDVYKRQVYPHFRLQKRRYKARNDSRSHRGGYCEIGVSRCGDRRADSRSQSEAAVGRKIAYIKH